MTDGAAQDDTVMDGACAQIFTIVGHRSPNETVTARKAKGERPDIGDTVTLGQDATALTSHAEGCWWLRKGAEKWRTAESGSSDSRCR